LSRSCAFTSGILAAILLFIQLETFGQRNNWENRAEIGGFAGSSGSLPFWLRANQFGTVPLQKQILSARTAVHYTSNLPPIDTSGRPIKAFGWGFGSEVVANAAPGTLKLLLPEAYLKLQWKKLEFWAGRRKEIIGIVDTTLSSGSFTWSGNSLPVPKIQIGFPHYVALPFLKDFVWVKGFFSHGWYNTPYIQGAYLHQKAFHVRLGKPGKNLSFQVGIGHHVTWGGHADYLKDSPHVVNGKLTDSFGDYLRGVVLAKVSKDFHNSRYTNFDGENRVGNHLGQFDLALEYQFKTSSLLLYNNHPFEDASGVLFQNLPDGLYGIRWKSKNAARSIFQVNAILLEFLFTKDQSGAGWNVNGSRFKGNDNYFNHSQYIEGWSYFGRGMGTPFITPKADIRPEIMGVREFFPSSRLVVYHFGLKGNLLGRVNWLMKASVGRYFGTNNIPYEPWLRQFSYLITADAPLLKKGNIRLVTRFAFDRGTLYVPTYAGYVGLSSSGWIR
jgi:hypothetical protein